MQTFLSLSFFSNSRLLKPEKAEKEEKKKRVKSQRRDDYKRFIRHSLYYKRRRRAHNSKGALIDRIKETIEHVHSSTKIKGTKIKERFNSGNRG